MIFAIARTPDSSPEEVAEFEPHEQQSARRGGAATLHRGRCSRTGRTVAIKSIPKESRHDRLAALGEAAVLRSLDHVHINRLLEVVEDEFSVHLILEYAEGMDLMEALLASGHVEEQTAASIVRQIAEALAYCHSQGVVHRDVKPENIMLRPGPEPFITLVDFGLASDAGEVVHGGEGTAAYLAPEVSVEPVVCEGSLDMFSLGVVLFAMLSGRLPARQATPALAEESLLRDVSPGARDFLRRLLVEPRHRLSASEALQHPWLQAEG
ncbi:unnamed protein product [Effrenium voratum]|nr:unnamed protein product [Effrenium voratum]CAJ1456797.1 unnamed protein product [Effrenium voratum]